MKIIGLTGGIASGKSSATNILRELGATIIDADIVAREIVQKGMPALEEIAREFGKDILNKDGTLNRRALGNIVFNDKNKLDELNQITHPKIRERINESILNYKENNEKVLFLDAALLIEMGLYKLVDEIWLVIIDKDTQFERLMKRDNLTYTNAEKRINSQMPLEEKLPYADVVIDNTGDMEELRAKVIDLYKKAFGGV